MQAFRSYENICVKAALGVRVFSACPIRWPDKTGSRL
jgi:hypothetical protein